MTRRVVLVGATGVFGQRLARILAEWPDIELILAARSRPDLERLANALAGRANIIVIDRARPQGIADLEPFAVIDCAGPFQNADYSFARAMLAAGAHYIDLADGRAFVAGFAAALDEAAKAAGRVAITGASSTPALSHAALDQLTVGWARIDKVLAAISPGAKAPRGQSAVRAVLSWVGRPVRVFTKGDWRERPGWGMTRRMDMAGLGRRWLSLAETPDLDLLVERFTPRREGLFLAGLELPIMHLGLALLAWPVRWRLLKSLTWASGPLRAAADMLVGFGSDRGGMICQAEGCDAEGRPVIARWSLWAEKGSGPNVPILPIAAALRALVDGRLTGTGAGPCVGLLGVDEIMVQARHLPISTRIDVSHTTEAGMWPMLFGPAFAAYPSSVRRLHRGLTAETFHGRAWASGSRGLARLIRRFFGMPKPGRYPNFKVELNPDARGEAWIRIFGRRRFGSHINPVPGDPGRFEEGTGPLLFRFEPEHRPHGFLWKFTSWRLGPMRLPKALAPRIRARTYEMDGVYRFRILIAHPMVGIIAGYAGRLTAPD
ncbi:DUF4166 domain-containing protein [soil metagenome]